MNPIIKEIPVITSSPEDIYIIHTSLCRQTNTSHFSPRIACVYTQNINGSDSSNFSIYNYASKRDIDLIEIENWYNDLEISILDELNEYLRNKTNCTFIYWENEGQELLFDLIKTRFQEINKGESNKVFTNIPINRRKSIQYLVKKTNAESIPSHDLKEFIKLFNNGQLINGFLSSDEEINCFENKDFTKINSSILAKVTFFKNLINDSASKTNANNTSKKDSALIDLQSMSPWAILKQLNLKSYITLFGLLTLAFSAGISIPFFNNEQLKDTNNEMVEELTLAKDSLKTAKKEIAQTNEELNKLKLESSGTFELAKANIKNK